jgi:Secretion system C-terminal sorting domain
MKKIITLLLISFSIATQSLNAQLDLAFVSNFSGNSTNSCNRLTWTIASNQSISSFEVEKSTNGKDFKTIAVLVATEKFNTESYTYSDTAISADKIMYRLRVLIKRSQNDFYSRIILVQSKMKLNNNTRIIENPVKDKLSFNYNSAEVQQADIKIYSLTGKILVNQKINSFKGNNLITIPLSSGFASGIYVLEINTDILNQTLKFVKQ